LPTLRRASALTAVVALAATNLLVAGGAILLAEVACCAAIGAIFKDKKVAEEQIVRWKPDSHSDRCDVCSDLFTMLRRRHHCRNCGDVVCDRCSRHSRVLLGSSVPKRVCEDRGRVWWRALPAHLPSEELDAAPGRRGRDLGDVGERAHDRLLDRVQRR